MEDNRAVISITTDELDQLYLERRHCAAALAGPTARLDDARMAAARLAELDRKLDALHALRKAPSMALNASGATVGLDLHPPLQS